MSNRLNQDREADLQPDRMKYAIEQITKLGLHIHYEDKTRISFMFNRKQVTLYPYSGWHAGKSIKDGRGLENLLNQLKK